MAVSKPKNSRELFKAEIPESRFWRFDEKFNAQYKSHDMTTLT